MDLSDTESRAGFATAWRALQGLGPTHFAGRGEELARLDQALAEPGTTISIAGLRGMGKTCLSRVFAGSRQAQFSGGVHALSLSATASPDDSLPDVHDPASLIILDDAEYAPPGVVQRFIERFRTRAPDSRVIVIGRVQAVAGPVLYLGPLSLDAMNEIWGSQQVELSRDGAHRLYQASQGIPFVGELIGRLARDRGLAPEQLFQDMQEFVQPGLVGASGQTLADDSNQYLQLVTGVRLVNDEALHWLDKHPDSIHELDPRQFEVLVADLFSREGWDVTLTPSSKDGGKDLYAAHKSGFATFLYIVECKRYAPDNPVGVGIVRSLYGVVQAEKLAGGIVATTSRFTKGAKEFQRDVKYQLNLADYMDVISWVRRALAPTVGGAP